ncbi:MAG: enolase C-terminal domain-like protein [Flavobacteriales bacterium]
MSLGISACPFHLLFKHPFGTAHGVRSGTDSVFVRLEQDGVFGHGEATMPPYVPEDQGSVLAVLASLDLTGIDLPSDLGILLARSMHLVGSAPCARAALTTAAFDLAGKLLNRPTWQMLEVPEPVGARMMFTLGLCAFDHIPTRISELPECDVLKVKLDGSLDIERTAIIKGHWSKALFLDVNQGWRTEQQANVVLDAIQGIQVAGIEQPYPKDDLETNRLLQRWGRATVFADESVQGLPDVRDRGQGFGGVNIKLMKCGGLDQAKAMAEIARANGQQVLLGSMSESSLGCTAAAHLSGTADLLDLDGPWLIVNDPFKGIGTRKGRLTLPEGPGLGVDQTAQLDFSSICA